MATLTQPTQRRGKSVQYGLDNDNGDDHAGRRSPAGTRVDVVDTDDEQVHLKHRSQPKSHINDPYGQLDDPRMGNKGDLYTLPSNGAKVDGHTSTVDLLC